MSSVTAVKIWIGLSIFATSAGWVLSCLGCLNLAGYIVLGVVALVMIVGLWLNGQPKGRPLRFNWNWAKMRRRFSGSFPLAFLLLAVLAFLGGILYPPSNHTALDYRIPRVLNWLAEGQWHWIWTPNPRLNTRACGIEWLSAPMLLVFKSDRLLFLLNWIPFLLLPGLLFSVLTRLGVRARVAWMWMWILPTGYVILLQAGSTGNDAFPMVYGLAAVDFALRAWKSRRASDLWYSGLALALLTGAKASNLPLCLVWAVLVAPLWRLLWEKRSETGAAAVLALLVSVAPTVLMNLAYCHSWSGLNIEKQGIDMANPLVGLWGNPIMLLVNNLCPPFFPMANWWNQHALEYVPGFLLRPLLNNFEPPFHQLWEIPTEDWAGIGPCVSVLMLIATVWAGIGFLRRRPARVWNLPFPRWVWKLALIAPWISLGAFCAKSGMVTPGRLIAPYYPLLLPALLVGAEQSALVRKNWWCGLTWLTFLVALVVLIITPGRPLWPARSCLARVLAADPGNRFVARGLATYDAYAVRWDPLGDLRAALPPDLKVVGMLAGPGDIDISLWRPYGTRRVANISPHEQGFEQIKAGKIKYAVVSDETFRLEGVNFDDWARKTRAVEITNTIVTTTVSAGPQKWILVRFPD
jgi:hypothetical protein